MKEDKDLKKGVELSGEELDGVTGGLGFTGFEGTNTMQYQPGMQMGANTMEYKPGANPAQAQTLEQKLRGVNPAQAANAQKGSGGAHSL